MGKTLCRAMSVFLWWLGKRQVGLIVLVMMMMMVTRTTDERPGSGAGVLLVAGFKLTSVAEKSRNPTTTAHRRKFENSLLVKLQAEEAEEDVTIKFEPYESGFVNKYGSGDTPGTNHMNEGGQPRNNVGLQDAFAPGVKFNAENESLSFLPGLSRTNQVLRFELEGVAPRQNCPSMVGPMSDGAYYCKDEFHGFCDRRSGSCHCFDGYQGLDCSTCTQTHTDDGSGYCLRKILCPNDCSGAGTCDFKTGVCACQKHRAGDDCSISACHLLDGKATSCDVELGMITECHQGYYVDTQSNSCSSCTLHDPRCLHCNEEKCLSCIDPLLYSISRSGRRKIDRLLPFDELDRELSETHDFGTQSPNYFDQAEVFHQIDSDALGGKALNETSVQCEQDLDSSWTCTPIPQSHLSCGHTGVISFVSPSFAVVESSQFVNVTIQRSGGGLGKVSVEYSLRHISTTDSDVSPTARYTSSQEVIFLPGVVKLTFKVSIHDDYELEPDKVFELVLHDAKHVETLEPVPLGPQRITKVVILDDDFWISSKDTTVINGTFSDIESDQILETYVHSRTATNLERTEPLGVNQKLIVHKSIYESNDLPLFFHDMGEETSKSCEYTLIPGTYLCSIFVDNVSFRYFYFIFARSGGLTGLYFDNAFALDSPTRHPEGAPTITRIDPVVDFVWGKGPLMPFATDFVSIRWQGGISPPESGNVTFQLLANDNARLFIDGYLIIDHWNRPTSGTNTIGSVSLDAESIHSIVIDYREKQGSAHVKLSWKFHESDDFYPVAADSLFQLDVIGNEPKEATSILPARMNESTTFATGNCLVKAIAGQSCTIVIHPRDRFQNVQTNLPSDTITDGLPLVIYGILDIASQPNNQIIAPARIYGELEFNVDAQTYQATFIPQAAGHYSLHIELDGNDIKDSPFTLQVDAWDPNGLESDLIGNGVDPLSPHVAGVEETFDVVVRDLHGNIHESSNASEIDVKIACQNSPFTVFDGIVQPASNGDPGVFQVTYVVHCASDVLLYVSCRGSKSDPVPLTFTHGDVSPRETFASGNGIARATSGVAATFTVHVRDEFSNPVQNIPLGTNFDISLLFQDETVEDFPSSCTLNSDDLMTCTYTPAKSELPGTSVVLDVKHTSSGERIFQNHTFLIEIVDGSCSADQSFAYGDGYESAVAGAITKVYVQAVDAAGNFRTSPCEENVILQVEAPIEHVSTLAMENGIYLLEYNATVSGRQNIDIRMNAVPLQNSPFEVNVEPNDVDYETSVVFGEGLSQGVVGHVQHVAIQAVDSYDNNLTDDKAIIEIDIFNQEEGEEPEQEDLVLSFRAPYTGNGSYDGSFVTTLAQKRDNARLVVRVAQPGIDGDYFRTATMDVDSLEFSKVEPVLDFNWRHPNDQVLPSRSNSFGVSWSGLIRAPTDGPSDEIPPCLLDSGAAPLNDDLVIGFRLRLEGGGARLWVENSLMVDEWPRTSKSLSDWKELEFTVKRGQLLPMRLDFIKSIGDVDSKVSLEWSVGHNIVDLSSIKTLVSSSDCLSLIAEKKFERIPSEAYFRWRVIEEYNPVYIPSETDPKSSFVLIGEEEEEEEEQEEVQQQHKLFHFESGVETTFKIQLRDEYLNNQIHHDDSILVLGFSHEAHVHTLEPPLDFHGTLNGTVTPIQGGEGEYLVQITPTLAGSFMLFVGVNLPEMHLDFGQAELIQNLDHYSIQGSPFQVSVLAGDCSHETSAAFGPNLNKTVAGKLSWFFIQANDAFGNARTNSIGDDILSTTWSDGPSVSSFVVEHQGEGLYKVSFVITSTGTFTLDVIMSDGMNIEKQIVIDVESAEADGESSFARIIGSEVSAGSDVFIEIETRDVHNNTLMQGGEEFVLEIIFKDKFTAQNTGFENVQDANDLLRYEYDKPWVDYLIGIDDKGNGTYVATLNSDPGFVNATVECSISLAKRGGLLGKYFSNSHPDESKMPEPLFERVDSNLDMSWVESLLDTVLSAISLDHRPLDRWVESSSARWTGYIKAEHTGYHTFWVENVQDDDTATLKVAGNDLDVAVGSQSPIYLRGGRLYSIELTLFQRERGASLALYWGVDLGANDDLGFQLNGTVAATKYSKTLETTEDLGGYLSFGDQVKINDQILIVEHYDNISRRIHLTEPYMGESVASVIAYRRVRTSVIPSENLFYSKESLGNSPLVLEFA